MINKSRRAYVPALLGVCGAIALTGCMQNPIEATRGPQSPAVPALAQIEGQKGQPSALIESLLARQSTLQTGTPFETVAQTVLASNARTAESELLAARLRANAAKYNWLPKIGPNISLTSLGDFVAQLVVEQVIYDNGRKKAERDLAASDVEAAAVKLSQDTNNRVGTALQLYITAERARKETRVSQQARKRMAEFAHIIEQRVNGGVSNMVDLRVAQEKLHELDAEIFRARENELTAMAELEAMAHRSLDGVQGLSGLTPTQPLVRLPLNVLLAQAQGEAKISQAKIDRAAMLPGLVATGTVGEGSAVGVNVSSDALVGVGTGAALTALQASQDAARRGVAQAQEDNERIIQRMIQKRASLERQQTESRALVAEARKTYNLFYDQFRNSGRPIMDVVNVFENTTRLERSSVRLTYELAAIEVEIAKLYGTLVDGEDV